jgi:hypothetical protein
MFNTDGDYARSRTASVLCGIALAASGFSPAVAAQDLTPMSRGNAWGYVDDSGKFVVAPQFESASEFTDGLAAVELGHRFGYIDQAGNVIVAPKYAMASSFREGFAWVVAKKPLAIGSGEYRTTLYGLVTFIDRDGREIVPPFAAEYVADFSEGRAAVRTGNFFGGCSGKIGFFDTKGAWAIEPQFDEARSFSAGLAAVNRGSKCHSGGKWGYIDRSGKEIVSVKYDYAGNFVDGRACVSIRQAWFFVNRQGDATEVDKRICLR